VRSDNPAVLGATCNLDSECGPGGACGKLAKVFREGSIKECAAQPEAPAVCGNGAAEAPEQCDDGNLANSDGCSSSCTLEPAHQLVATGQTTCWNTVGTVIACAGTGHDGDIQAGAPLAYADNGNTITDVSTGLMWEKLDDNDVGGIHDKDNAYTWANAFAVKIAALNSGSGFAGHTDWRVPNVKELESIVNYEIPYPGPTVAVAFNNACSASCTVTTCSCTLSQVPFWSSSSNASTTSFAWSVWFLYGYSSDNNKTNLYPVRAVRGGL
jgi:cysteine-rich repeat protein